MYRGKLDRQIQFRRATLVDDGFGVSETWANHGAKQWAAKTDIMDGEKWRGNAIAAHATSRFIVRYNTFTKDIDPRDHLKFEGVEYNIIGIKEVGGRRRWLEMTAASRADMELIP